MGLFLLILIPFWIWGLFDAAKQVEIYNENLSRQLSRIRNLEKNKNSDLNNKNSRNEEQKNSEDKTTKEKNKIIKTDDFINRMKKLSKLRESDLSDENEYEDQKNNLITSLKQSRQEDNPEDFLSALIPLKEEKHVNDNDIKEIKKHILKQTI